MSYLKARIFGFILIILGAGLIYINWRQLWQEGSFEIGGVWASGNDRWVLSAAVS